MRYEFSDMSLYIGDGIFGSALDGVADVDVNRDGTWVIESIELHSCPIRGKAEPPKITLDRTDRDPFKRALFAALERSLLDQNDTDIRETLRAAGYLRAPSVYGEEHRLTGRQLGLTTLRSV